MTVGTWGPAVPNVVGVERELARIRRERSAHAREQTATVARAAVVNIVVMARREAHAARAARIVADLATRHPSRAIIVLQDPTGDTQISLHCQVASPGRAEMVYGERVLVRSHGAAGERLSTVVVPLLVPDLPLFVWWTETPPIGDAIFDQLTAIAHRLVVDSAEFPRPERTLPRLASFRVLGEHRCALTDLNWARLTAWRELLTQFFDVASWRGTLDRIHGVRISFGVDAEGREVVPSQALLLVGWIASRLGWTAAEPLAPSEAGGHLFRMRRADGAPVWVRLRPRFERGADEGDVTGIRIDTDLDGRPTQFRIHKAVDRRSVAATVRIGDDIVAERIVPLPATDVDELLSEELTILASDRVFEDALATLVTLA